MSIIKNFFLRDLLFVIILFFLDRITKLFIIFYSKNSLNDLILQTKYLNFYLIWNKGIAFGLLALDKIFFYNILSLIIFIISILILKFGLKENGIRKYSFLMIFTGAIGNLFDRVFYGSVPDFIDFHINGFHWFIFNVADIFITIGVIFLILTEFFEPTKKDKKL